ncbi:hypothetical protein B0T10DRAFT_469220 [Thelonectria olida]|uniref:Secreted protein n=1 Tax=Thelonectria olida TaxID=1576542 RepID=A0A9P8WI47_9HYPO|nr:hypothetical protein B0T10DRAFT_469220 [Thelonectria olida]
MAWAWAWVCPPTAVVSEHHCLGWEPPQRQQCIFAQFTPHASPCFSGYPCRLSTRAADQGPVVSGGGCSQSRVVPKASFAVYPRLRE